MRKFSLKKLFLESLQEQAEGSDVPKGLNSLYHFVNDPELDEEDRKESRAMVKKYLDKIHRGLASATTLVFELRKETHPRDPYLEELNKDLEEAARKLEKLRREINLG